MRKLILISVIVISVIISCVATLPWFISIVGLDKELTRYVENSLNEGGEQALALGRVRFNWTSVHLEEAHFIDRDQGSVLSVKGIRFGYNPFKLATDINNPIDAVNEIYLVEPTVVIRSDNKSPETTATPIDSVVQRIQKIWQYFTKIDRIQLSRGRIMIKRESGQTFTVVRELDGWMQHEDSSRIYISASGEMFNSSSENIAMQGHFDLGKNHYDAEVFISQLKLSSLKDVEDTGLPEIQTGILNGHLKLNSGVLILDSLKVSGELDIQGASVNINGRSFDEINLKCTVEHNRLTVSQGSFNEDASAFTITGSMENIFAPGCVTTKHQELVSG